MSRNTERPRGPIENTESAEDAKTIRSPERTPDIAAMIEEELASLDNEVTRTIAESGTIVVPDRGTVDPEKAQTIERETRMRLAKNEEQLNEAVTLAKEAIDAFQETRLAAESGEQEKSTDQATTYEDPAGLAERFGALIADAKDMDSAQKIAAIIPMLKVNPLYAGVMGEAGFTQQERLTVLESLAEEDPKKFLDAAYAADQEYPSKEKVDIAVRFADIDPKLFDKTVTALRMSQAQVQKALEALPTELRAAVLEKMAVPNVHGAKTREGEAPLNDTQQGIDTEKTMERVETEQRLGDLEKASARLSEALVTAFPERARKERAHMERERVLRGNITSYGELGGASANAPRFLILEGSPLPAVYKLPAHELRTLPDGRTLKIISSIEAGQMAWREPLSFMIDRTLDLGIVPTTIMRDGPEGAGSVQEWRVGQIAENAGAARLDKARGELMKLALLDLVTNACDRHDSNYMIDPDNKIIAIDNGAVFPKRLIKADGVRSFALRKVKGERIPPELHDSVTQLLKEPAVLESLKQGFMASLNGDAEDAWKYFTDKLKEIAADENWTFPDTEWHSEDVAELLQPIEEAN